MGKSYLIEDSHSVDFLVFALFSSFNNFNFEMYIVIGIHEYELEECSSENPKLWVKGSATRDLFRPNSKCKLLNIQICLDPIPTILLSLYR